jgi:hypothetical protein
LQQQQATFEKKKEWISKISSFEKSIFRLFSTGKEQFLSLLYREKFKQQLQQQVMTVRLILF